MTINIPDAFVYDEETFPNAFTLAAEHLHKPLKSVWEISEFRDDRRELFTWLDYLAYHQIPMIGFFNLKFDYPILHWFMQNRTATVAQIYVKSQEISRNFDSFGSEIWQKDRFIPQIDIFKICHFDNKAKRTSLKALQINRRSEEVVDMPLDIGTVLTEREIREVLIPYNQHDVSETKGFVLDNEEAVNFRIGLLDTLRGDVMNFSDVKIGATILEQRMGDDVCYTPAYYDNDPFTGERTYNRKQKRQTIRSRINLNDIIFPYIHFNHPEFQRVHQWLKQQVLTPEDLGDTENETPRAVKTKGVFKGLHADVGNVTFYFGTGGIHASISPQRIFSDDQYLIQDIDVKGFYPNAAIVNKLAPEHLGDAFRREYARLPEERDVWIKKKGKKCVEANTMKLAGNGVYGQSNNAFSIFYDPQYTMSVTINCQLLLCMLAEWLLAIPTLQIIQANTDGITYRIHRNYEPQAICVRDRWQKYTCLVLEDVQYKRMWIRDVNNYVAEDMKGNLKLKGAYWTPDPLNYIKSIAEAQPPAWHKDLSNLVSIRAAVAAMVYSIDPEFYIRSHTNKFDFMLRAKVDRGSKLMLGNQPIQNTSRYYVSTNGKPLKKVSPPVAGHNVGEFKRKAKVPEAEYQRILREIGPGVWDARIHTANKSTHQMRESAFEAGWLVTECNKASSFSFENINYKYYVEEARKLII